MSGAAMTALVVREHSIVVITRIRVVRGPKLPQVPFKPAMCRLVAFCATPDLIERSEQVEQLEEL